jgi:hypothetical protein
MTTQDIKAMTKASVEKRSVKVATQPGLNQFGLNAAIGESQQKHRMWHAMGQKFFHHWPKGLLNP